MARDMDLGTLVVFGAGLGIVRASLADDTKTTYRSTKTQSKDTKRQGAHGIYSNFYWIENQRRSEG
jgi:hypothetical protein